MPYAINIADLTKYKEDYPLAILLSSVIDRNPDHVIQADTSRWDEMGTRLNCDEDRAKAIVSIIRMRLKKHELRIYQSMSGNGNWKRI